MVKKAEDPDQKQSFPRKLLDQSSAARLAYFKAYAVAHPFLERANKEIWDALQKPGEALMIFIVGPTGVGKTTLWEHIDRRLTVAAQAKMLQDPDHMPVINLYAMAPSSRQFRWPDFYTRALDRCNQYITDIEEGEKSLKANPEATERLMVRLGLNARTRQTKEIPLEETEDEEAPKKKAHSPRRRVGQRNPVRDEVKKEATDDE